MTHRFLNNGTMIKLIINLKTHWLLHQQCQFRMHQEYDGHFIFLPDEVTTG